jgi:hypothetical protein
VDAVDFVVSRADLSDCRFVPAPAAEDVVLADGEVLARVDCFALTANNVTYGVAGDMLSYWSFFPADAGWGRIPVWGFGTVRRSRHPAVPVGERLFGYFPMSTHVVLQPGAVTATHVVDSSPHRRELPPIYNQYTRTTADPLYTRDTEDRQMLFRPLFLTGFLLDDFLAEHALFGASSVVLTSASSKTAFSLAALLSRNRRAPGGVVGLTSARNVAFVRRLGCYDRVLSYDDATTLPRDTPIVIVDMAGDGPLLATLHRHLGDGVRYSCLVGITHHDHMDRPAELPGATPTFFFAPDHARKRAAALGASAFGERTVDAWRTFLAESDGWLTIRRGRGRAAVEQVYRDTLAGRARPDEGHVLSLSDEGR